MKSKMPFCAFCSAAMVNPASSGEPYFELAPGEKPPPCSPGFAHERVAWHWIHDEDIGLPIELPLRSRVLAFANRVAYRARPLRAPLPTRQATDDEPERGHAPKFGEYSVSWAIDLDAASHRQAAVAALGHLRAAGPNDRAHIFVVTSSDGVSAEVDLDDEPQQTPEQDAMW